MQEQFDNSRLLGSIFGDDMVGKRKLSFICLSWQNKIITDLKRRGRGIMIYFASEGKILTNPQIGKRASPQEVVLLLLKKAV